MTREQFYNNHEHFLGTAKAMAEEFIKRAETKSKSTIVWADKELKAPADLILEFLIEKGLNVELTYTIQYPDSDEVYPTFTCYHQLKE